MSTTTDGVAQEPVLGQAEGQAATGQPVEQPVGGGEQPVEQTEQTPEYVTRADAERMMQEALNQARSYADKGRVRVENAVNEVRQSVETMRNLGREISDEEAATLEATAVRKAMTATEDEPARPTPAQAQEAQYVQNNLYEHSLMMQGKYGVSVLPTDPEAKMMRITGDPEQDKAAVEAMYKAKASRQAASGQQPPEQVTTTSAAVRVPSNGGNAPAGIAENSREYWERLGRERKK